ncbi:MAG: hypothetical protein JSC189_000730 [Candidatus Tokpelaia sp. JSC189]|nr:MAG: hypothetical protein JSC189_000730 [Candidatus Tokpelaia sp. JSC189]
MISLCRLTQQYSAASFVWYLLDSLLVWLCSEFFSHAITTNQNHLQTYQPFRKFGQTNADKQAIFASAEMKTTVSGKSVFHFLMPTSKSIPHIIPCLMTLPISDNKIVFPAIMDSISQQAPPFILPR